MLRRYLLTEQGKDFFSIFIPYFLWTLSPFYLKLLLPIDSYELSAHRAISSCLTMTFFFIIFRRKIFLQQCKLLTPKSLLLLFISSSMIGLDWLVYIYAIQNDLALQASLGYFFSPILFMTIALLVFREKINSLQAISILLSTLGVFYLFFSYSSMLWVSFCVAFSFAIYAIIHKQIKFKAAFSFFIETIFLFPVGLVYLIFVASQGKMHFLSVSWKHDLGTLLLGIVSSLPFILLSYGIKKVSFIFLGFVQFYLPITLFLVGVFVFKESFDTPYKIAFGLIWLAIILFLLNSYLQHKKIKKIK